ncbi:FCD domain-containing protein [Ahrensia kielensis]|uniref:FCD domain-containing protein n=1 Tax=Ahrensia kielensis TaxID=76980 RepID=A0ABU9TAM8_9HYPH
MSEIRETESERAYRVLRGNIIDGTLEAGLKLKVVPLKAQYNFGAAPLREALTKLVGDRLVVQETQKGFTVAIISVQDAQDVGRVRGLLECEALRESLRNGDDAWEARIVAAYHRLRLVENRVPTEITQSDIEARNTEFHDALLSSAHSNWLLTLREQVYLHHERYRLLSRSNLNLERNTPAEHAAIFEAALARDLDLTCTLVTEHINRTTEAAIKML